MRWVHANASLVVWAADFNYRIDLPNDEVREYAANDDLDPLAAADQLALARDEGEVFEGYEEGPLTFLPTYKYDNGTDTYDSSEKQRIPSWTDRVLYKGRDVKLRSYDRAAIRTSDHRPVYAVFDVTVPEVDEAKKTTITNELRRQAYQTGGLKLDSKVEQAAQGGVRGLVKEFTSVSLDSTPVSSKPPSPVPRARPPVSRDSKPKPKTSGDKFAAVVNTAYARLGTPPPPLPPRHAPAGATAVPYEPRRRPPPPADFKKLGLPEEITPVATGDFVLVPSPKRNAPPLPSSVKPVPVRQANAPPLPRRHATLDLDSSPPVGLEPPCAPDVVEGKKPPPLAPKPKVEQLEDKPQPEDKPKAKPEIKPKPDGLEAKTDKVKPEAAPKPAALRANSK